MKQLLNKLGDALRLLTGNLALFGAIILTVQLPVTLLVIYLDSYVDTEEDGIALLRWSMWAEMIFAPIYIAALIHALTNILENELPSYTAAMMVGFRKWLPLLLAQIVAGIFIGLGLLLFIVPGIMLMVRYALLNAVVVLEDAGPGEARRRSTQLTVGIRWQIFFFGLLFNSVLMALVVFIPSAQSMAVAVVTHCIVDVVYAVMPIGMFLFYWEATDNEFEATRPADEPESFQDTVPDDA